MRPTSSAASAPTIRRPGITQFHWTPAELPAELLHSLDRAVVGLNPFEKADYGPTTRDNPAAIEGPANSASVRSAEPLVSRG